MLESKKKRERRGVLKKVIRMGKRNNKSSGNGGYVHKQTYNKKARESDHRRSNQMINMTITRLKKMIEKQMKLMSYYIPEEKKKKPRLGRIIYIYII